MTVYAKKNKVILVITYQKQTDLPTSEIKLNFNNTMLKTSEQLLRIILDKHLSWIKHIVKMVNTLNKIMPSLEEFKHIYLTRLDSFSIELSVNHTSIAVVPYVMSNICSTSSAVLKSAKQ